MKILKKFFKNTDVSNPPSSLISSSSPSSSIQTKSYKNVQTKDIEQPRNSIIKKFSNLTIKSPNTSCQPITSLTNSTSSSSSTSSTVNPNQNPIKSLICTEESDDTDQVFVQMTQPNTNLSAHIIYEEPDSPSVINSFSQDGNTVEIPVSMRGSDCDTNIMDDCTTPTNSSLHLKYLSLSPSMNSTAAYPRPHNPILSPTSTSCNQVWIPRTPTNGCVNEVEVFSNTKDLPTDLNNINPAFTIRRHIIHIQEEHKQIETLKKTIETKLKIQMPLASNIEEIGVALSDGVVLCHLINQIFPRSVAIIHVPSLSMPKLSLAKCRKNVENFIDACRRIGLPENDICCAHDIIESKNTAKVARTILMLNNYSQILQQQSDVYSSARSNLTTIGNAMLHPNSTVQTSQQPQQQQTAV